MKRLGWLLVLTLTGCASEKASESKVPTAKAEASQTVATQSDKSEESKTVTASKTTDDKIVTTASGLRYEIVAPGTGAEAKAGDTVEVHYTGRLTNGTKFDSSLDHGEPIAFRLGAGMVIKGWDEGIAGMKVGEKRKLMIPSDLAYGSRGAGRDIPPNAALNFDVELVGIKGK